MPEPLSDAIETAIKLFDDDTAPKDVAEYIFNNRPQAANMAVHWDPKGVIGAIGRLVQESLPSFEGVTYGYVLGATKAFVSADLVADQPSPLARHAAIVVYECIDQPQAAFPVCVDALAARMGTVPEISPPTPADIPTEHATEVFKRVKTFLGQLPKGDETACRSGS